VIGIQPLIAMRRRGIRPVLVAVETDPSMRSFAMVWPEDGQARLLVDPSEAVHRLDFRPCIGCVCMVCGSDEGRIKAICEVLQAAGAKPFGMLEVRKPWGVERTEVFNPDLQEA